ncbi:MAG: polysaccharide deacetylase family protein [Acidobacteriia bacterium]|nr:polysaccharide deacetylase family protein [Terriglobia bacterium]
MVLIPAGAALASSAFLAWAVRGRSARVFGDSVWRGPRERRAVALTFDDGPSEGTPEILEILARYGAAATFFQCGANVERLPSIARAVIRCSVSALLGSSKTTCGARRTPSNGAPARLPAGSALPLACAGSGWPGRSAAWD